MLRSALGPSTGPAAAASLGRFELLCEAFRCDLGAMWSVRASTGHEGGDVLHARRFAIDGADPGVVDELSGAAFWGMDVSHPKVTRVMDVVVEGSELGLVQERHEGEPLSSLLRLARNAHAPIPLPVVLRIALDVVDALAAVHAAGRATSSTEYAYGGVSPDSVVVGSDGVARLTDVGASAVVSRCRPWANRPGVIGYRSPEQVETRRADIRVDVFSVGILLWEMISNHRLFAAANPETALTAMKTRSIYRLDSPRLRLTHPPPAAVADLVETALARDPKARSASVEELGAALRLVSSGLAADAAAVGAAVRDLAGQKLESRAKALARAMLGSEPAEVAGPRRAETMRGLQAQAESAVDRSASPAPPIVVPAPSPAVAASPPAPAAAPAPPVAPVAPGSPAQPPALASPAVAGSADPPAPRAGRADAPAPRPRPLGRVPLEKAAAPRAKTLVGIPGPTPSEAGAEGAQKTPLEIAVPRKQMQTLLGIPPPARLDAPAAFSDEEDTTVAGRGSPLADLEDRTLEGPPPAAGRAAMPSDPTLQAPPPGLPTPGTPPVPPAAPRLPVPPPLPPPPLQDPSPSPISLEASAIVSVESVPVAAAEGDDRRPKRSRHPPPVPAPTLESVIPKPLPDIVPPEPSHELIAAEALERAAQRGAQKSLPDGVIAVRPLIAVSIPSEPPPGAAGGRTGTWVALGAGSLLVVLVALLLLTGAPDRGAPDGRPASSTAAEAADAPQAPSASPVTAPAPAAPLPPIVNPAASESAPPAAPASPPPEPPAVVDRAAPRPEPTPREGERQRPPRTARPERPERPEPEKRREPSRRFEPDDI